MGSQGASHAEESGVGTGKTGEIGQGGGEKEKEKGKEEQEEKKQKKEQEEEQEEEQEGEGEEAEQSRYTLHTHHTPPHIPPPTFTQPNHSRHTPLKPTYPLILPIPTSTAYTIHPHHKHTGTPHP